MRRGRGGPAPLVGEVQVPGDKSISHRALVLAALAEGTSSIAGLNLGHDVRATASCIGLLGAGVRLNESNSHVEVHSPGAEGLHEPAVALDAGNSGTTIRLLLGVCAGIDGLTILSGDASLRARPMLRVVAPLRQMGARIDGRAHGDRAPVAVRGGALEGVDLDLPVASAQVKGALLVAGLRASGRTTVAEPGQSRDHTERMLRATGVSVTTEGAAVAVSGPARPRPRSWAVPGDISSAMFLIVAAALLPGSDLTVVGVGLNPTRTGALDVLAEMGADVRVEVEGEDGGEPFGSVRIRHSELHAVPIHPDRIPGLIDELPALAIAASRAEGQTVISGAAELRVKESDRIAAMVDGLTLLGADARALPDGMVITGPCELAGGAVDSHGDHRVAMAFAVAGLVTSDAVRIKGWSSVDTSFPGFLDVLAKARGAR
ncbi:MAG: 3-phosphoshikimate 1-carboxyvinyltransferase [Actinomycetota bacterium]|nr:3-phosphoshikimate 1-carboxyvinyltransferase [Actinomycetota bacterium]